MTFIPPCRREGADPEDWFIDTDGKQYRDEDLVSVEEADEIRAGHEDDDVDVEDVIAALEEERARANLVKRRHAIEACFNDCLTRVRLGCLEAGMDSNHGVWGGYTAKQRRAIRAVRKENDELE